MINNYKYANRQWDRYGAYYSDNNGFDMFDTAPNIIPEEPI